MRAPTKQPLRVLAIDPGYDRLGIAVVEGESSRPVLRMSDCFIPPKGSQEQRLAAIEVKIEDVVRHYRPDALGLESLFFGLNKKTALKVAEVRGTVLAAAGRAGLPLIECSPPQVKLAVTGYGRSNKNAIGVMVPRLLSLPKKKRLDDELDAIAIGITTLALGYKVT